MDDDTFEDEVSNAESVLDNETPEMPETPETEAVPTEQVKAPKDQTSTEKIEGLGFDYDYAQDENKSNSVKTFTVPENIVNANPDANMDVVNREYSSLMQLIDKGEDVSSTLNSINNLGIYTPATKKAIFDAIKESHPEINTPVINSDISTNPEPKTPEPESADSSENTEENSKDIDIQYYEARYGNKGIQITVDGEKALYDEAFAFWPDEYNETANKILIGFINRGYNADSARKVLNNIWSSGNKGDIIHYMKEIFKENKYDVELNKNIYDECKLIAEISGNPPVESLPPVPEVGDTNFTGDELKISYTNNGAVKINDDEFTKAPYKNWNITQNQRAEKMIRFFYDYYNNEEKFDRRVIDAIRRTVNIYNNNPLGDLAVALNKEYEQNKEYWTDKRLDDRDNQSYEKYYMLAEALGDETTPEKLPLPQSLITAQQQREEEEKARKLAEEEAARKAAEEKAAKEQAEKEAREKAEREAREQAEKEAREKAEKEAREKAEAEARKKAEEEEAKRKHEETLKNLQENPGIYQDEWNKEVASKYPDNNEKWNHLEGTDGLAYYVMMSHGGNFEDACYDCYYRIQNNDNYDGPKPSKLYAACIFFANLLGEPTDNIPTPPEHLAKSDQESVQLQKERDFVYELNNNPDGPMAKKLQYKWDQEVFAKHPEATKAGGSMMGWLNHIDGYNWNFEEVANNEYGGTSASMAHDAMVFFAKEIGLDPSTVPPVPEKTEEPETPPDEKAEDEVINTADAIPEESESKEPTYDFTDNSSPEVRRAANEEFNRAKRLYDSGKHVLPLLVRDRKTGALSGIDTYLNAAVNKCLEGNIEGANNELINIYRLIQEKYNKNKKDLSAGGFFKSSTLDKMVKELDTVHNYIKAFFNMKGGDFSKALLSPNSPAEMAYDDLYRGYVIEYETLSIREEKLKLIMEQTDSES